MSKTFAWVAHWSAKEWHLASHLVKVPGSQSGNGQPYTAAYTVCGMDIAPVVPKYQVEAPQDGRAVCMICQGKADFRTLTEGDQ